MEALLACVKKAFDGVCVADGVPLAPGEVAEGTELEAPLVVAIVEVLLHTVLWEMFKPLLSTTSAH